MDQRDVETELAGARDLLDSTSAGHLAYTATDGTPRVIPVGYYWTGEQFVISTAFTAPKVAALSARPDVALAIDAEAAAQFEQNCREMYDRMARIAITPRWARYYDFGAGRMPKFLQELVERSGGEARNS